MLKKCASVIKGEYVEWAEDEGPAHPQTHDDKINEIKHKMLPIVKSITKVPDYSEEGIGSRGMRVA